MHTVKTNMKRCPHIKIHRKEIKYEGDKIVSEIIIEEFNDCYGKGCMAWDDKNKTCKIFDMSIGIPLDPPDEQ